MYESLKNRLIFGEVISISIAAYFEFLISGYLQTRKPLDTTNGECFGGFVAIIGLILVLLAMPAAFGYLLTRSKDELAETGFKERWGMLYEWSRLNSKWHYAYFMLFTVRRIIFVAFAVFILYEYNSFQIMGIIYLNMFISIY